MNTRRFKLFTLLALLLNGCSTPQTMFVYNFSGETIELVLTKQWIVNDQIKKSIHTETLKHKSYGIYNAAEFLPERLLCGFEVDFFKAGKKYSYTYDANDYIKDYCHERTHLK